MLVTREEAEARVCLLKAEADAVRNTADNLSAGTQQDAHRMRSERLADEIWSIEEAFDLDYTPSGLWH